MQPMQELHLKKYWLPIFHKLRCDKYQVSGVNDVASEMLLGDFYSFKISSTFAMTQNLGPVQTTIISNGGPCFSGLSTLSWHLLLQDAAPPIACFPWVPCTVSGAHKDSCPTWPMVILGKPRRRWTFLNISSFRRCTWSKKPWQFSERRSEN